MISTAQNDLLFDDSAILKQFIAHQQLTFSSPTTDCDCIGYAAPISDDNFDPDQVAPSVG